MRGRGRRRGLRAGVAGGGVHNCPSVFVIAHEFRIGDLAGKVVHDSQIHIGGIKLGLNIAGDGFALGAGVARAWNGSDARPGRAGLWSWLWFWLGRFFAQGIGGFLFARRGRNDLPAFGLQALCVLAKLLEHFVDVIAALAGVFLPDAVDFIEDFVVFHVLLFHQFGWGANDRAGQPASEAGAFNAVFQSPVVDMPAVPREQKVHSVRRGNAQMGGVIGGNGRDNPIPEQPPGKLFAWRSRRQDCDVAEFFKTRASELGVATPGLAQHKFGDEQIEIVPPLFPPFLRGLLIRRQPQVPAAPRHQITWDGGFEIEPGFHLRA
jgi:hypothetical protein